MVGVLGQGYAVTGYRVYRTDGTFEDFPPERMIHWRGYNPRTRGSGISRLETLRQELVEDSATQAAITELATERARRAATSSARWRRPSGRRRRRSASSRAGGTRAKASPAADPGARGGDGVREHDDLPEGRRAARRRASSRWRRSRSSTGSRSGCSPRRATQEQAAEALLRRRARAGLEEARRPARPLDSARPSTWRPTTTSSST